MESKWSTLNYDMGEVKEGTIFEGKFVFNDDEVEISSAAGSCGCTVSSWTNTPNKEVTFKYTAPNLGANQFRKVSKSINVKLSDGTTHALTIMGKVIK